LFDSGLLFGPPCIQVKLLLRMSSTATQWRWQRNRIC